MLLKTPVWMKDKQRELQVFEQVELKLSERMDIVGEWSDVITVERVLCFLHELFDVNWTFLYFSCDVDARSDEDERVDVVRGVPKPQKGGWNE